MRHASRARETRRYLRAAIASALALVVGGLTLPAQEKLVGASVATTGAIYESWSLPTAMAITASTGTLLVAGASQLTVPLALVVPVAAGWTADLYSAYVSGRVRLQRADGTTPESYRLDGPADTRLRLVGRLRGDALLLTLGATLPTGRTRLDEEQLGALAVLAAPGLRLRTPVLGAGRGATAGLVLSRQLSGWGIALGTSYESRGTYAPAEALQAGAPTADLRPGNAIHASLAADRTAGVVRHTLSATADVYQNGELRNTVGTAERTTLALGPSFTGSYQLDVAWGANESVLFVVGRRRGSFTLGGETVPQSARTEVEGGVQNLHALTSSRRVRVAFEGRFQSTSQSAAFGASATDSPNVGFATAGAAIGGATLAMRIGRAHGPWMIEPFARGQFGRLDFGAETRTVTGLSAGVTMSGSF